MADISCSTWCSSVPSCSEIWRLRFFVDIHGGPFPGLCSYLQTSVAFKQPVITIINVTSLLLYNVVLCVLGQHPQKWEFQRGSRFCIVLSGWAFVYLSGGLWIFMLCRKTKTEGNWIYALEMLSILMILLFVLMKVFCEIIRILKREEKSLFTCVSSLKTRINPCVALTKMFQLLHWPPGTRCFSPEMMCRQSYSEIIPAEWEIIRAEFCRALSCGQRNRLV